MYVYMYIYIERERTRPVIDGGRVGLWLVKEFAADSPSSAVAAWVEHTPPHALLPCCKRRRRSPGCRRSGWRTRAAATSSLIHI